LSRPVIVLAENSCAFGMGAVSPIGWLP